MLEESALYADWDEEIISEINLTPLVDVALVLVIIFMIVAPFFSKVLQPLLLPRSASAQLSQTQHATVSILPNLKIAAGERFVSLSEASSAIREEIRKQQTPWVVLRAGEGVPHGMVLDLLGMSKDAGAKRVAFATHPKEAKR